MTTAMTEPQIHPIARATVGIVSSGRFGAWVPAETPPDSWRLVAWAWRGGGYAAGYYGGEQVEKHFRGWRRYDHNPAMRPDFWCDFPPLPNDKAQPDAQNL